MSKILRQLLLSAVTVGVALYVWVQYVPAAHPFLERLGVDEWLGLELASADQPAQRPRQFDGGAPRVVVEEVADQAIADRIRAIGDARAEQSVTLRALAVGLVTEINVTPGAELAAGDIVVRLENEAEIIALRRATIILKDAEEALERVQRLQGNVTEVRLRDAELALDTARLELREAEFNLHQREIRAPIRGRVGLMDVEVGERVQAQDALTTITDRSTLIIDFRLPERVVPLLELGQAVSLKPLALADTWLEGRISAVDTVVDRTSRTLRVQAVVNNSDDRLRPGMAFEIELEFPGAPLLTIPPLAVQWSSEGAFVWIVKESKATRVPVQIRQRNAQNVLVDANGGQLRRGDLVVIEGVQFLRPGAEVEVLNQASDQVDASNAPKRL